jgi:hypothetical protein
MLQVLEQDFARIPELLGRGQPAPETAPAAPPVVAVEQVQLGLF